MSDKPPVWVNRRYDPVRRRVVTFVNGFPDGRCPLCGGLVLYSEAFRSWACADPNCTLTQSDAGPGGGFPA